MTLVGRLIPVSRRYALPALALATTITAVVLALRLEDPPSGLLLVAATGPPATALLLARAAAHDGATWGRLAVAALLGATAIPAIVIAIHGAVLGAVYALVGPLGAAGRELLDELRVEPELVEVLTSPWALLFLAELALVAPIAEESLKPLAARVMRPGSRREAFLLGAAAGAGFAAVENVLYASGSFYSAEWWLSVAVLRSTGAALHLVGAGLISVVWYERAAGLDSRLSLAKAWGIAVSLHMFWNGSIAVAIVLFEERFRVGFAGSGWQWGLALDVVLAMFGMALLGAIVLVARWATPEQSPSEKVIDFTRPGIIAGWAGLAMLLIIPTTVLILVFPSFLAL